MKQGKNKILYILKNYADLPCTDDDYINGELTDIMNGCNGHVRLYDGKILDYSLIRLLVKWNTKKQLIKWLNYQYKKDSDQYE